MIIIITFSSLFVQARDDCLQEAPVNELGRSMRPEKQTFYISPSGHFYIHYDTTGNAKADIDYVKEVGIIADSSYKVLVNDLGYQEEPFDGEGGYDIYIMSYGAGVYGYNYKEGEGTSYLQIDNDYLGYNSKFNLSPIEIMRISVAHEYFHGIQWGYRSNLGNNAYFYEMTSMWFEDVMVPDGNDYLDGWVDPLLDNPIADFDNTGNGYELALFGHYLSSFLDSKGIEDAKNSTIIREVWEKMATSNLNAFSSLRNILENNYSISFQEIWVDFMSRNLFNGIDSDYYYYNDQDLIRPIEFNLIDINNADPFALNIDSESIALKSYALDELDTLFITHSDDNYIGRVISISNGSLGNKITWSSNNTSFISNNQVHFIYAHKNQDTLVVNMFDTFPYDYSLQDLNPNSDTYGEIISPSYFENQVTLHYFGHQY